MRDPTDLPSKCDGCGASLTLQHALDCKVGGLVIQRHNEIRYCVGDIAAQVWTQVVREPIVREAETQVDDSGLRLDLGVRGVWQPQAEALFDFKVIDTDAPSNSNRSPESVLVRFNRPRSIRRSSQEWIEYNGPAHAESSAYQLC